MKYNLESRVVDSNGLLDLSLYSFVPNKQIYELVLKATTSNGNSNLNFNTIAQKQKV